MDWLVPAASAVASFIGSYAALKVHVDYLRRDVDLAHKRIDLIESKFNKG